MSSGLRCLRVFFLRLSIPRITSRPDAASRPNRRGHHVHITSSSEEWVKRLFPILGENHRVIYDTWSRSACVAVLFRVRTSQTFGLHKFSHGFAWKLVQLAVTQKMHPETNTISGRIERKKFAGVKEVGWEVGGMLNTWEECERMRRMDLVVRNKKVERCEKFYFNGWSFLRWYCFIKKD